MMLLAVLAAGCAAPEQAEPTHNLTNDTVMVSVEPRPTAPAIDTAVRNYTVTPIESGYVNNGSRISVRVYEDTHDISREALTEFLAGDDTVNTTYVEGQYVCSNFAIRLYEDAGAQGIAANIVSVGFEGERYGHMLVAFNTTDEGMVYVDASGITDDMRAAGYKPAYYRADNLTVGAELWELSMTPPFYWKGPYGKVNGIWTKV
jgi:hypothetical protein